MSNLASTLKICFAAGCEALRTFSPRATEKDSVILINLEEHFGTIAGVVCGTLGLLLAIFIFLLLRYRKQSYYKLHYLAGVLFKVGLGYTTLLFLPEVGRNLLKPDLYRPEFLSFSPIVCVSCVPFFCPRRLRPPCWCKSLIPSFLGRELCLASNSLRTSVGLPQYERLRIFISFCCNPMIKRADSSQVYV